MQDPRAWRRGMNLMSCIVKFNAFLGYLLELCAGRVVRTTEASLMRNGAAGGTAAARPSTARERLRAAMD